ncbi:hypothetical protein D3C78_1001480 [compost metagenome]
MSVIAAGLRGGRGDPGPPFRVDAQGTLAERADYNNELANFTYLATDNGYLYFKGSLPGAWSDGMLFRGPQGPVGASFILRGQLASTADLPLTGEIGHAWLIGGHAWVWGGSSWTDAGQIQGEKGLDGANGADGRGVASLAVDGNRHLIITFTDSSTADAGLVPTVAGADGVSVVGVALNGAKHLLVTLSNGQTVDAGLVPTAVGANGADGRGISGVTINGAGHLIVTFTDSSTVDVGLVKGADGAAGVGVSGVAVDGLGHLQVTLTNGSTVDAGAIPVVNGADGADGDDGRGVVSVAIDEAKHLIVTFSDATTQDAGPLPSSDEVAALQQTINELVARIEALESAGPSIPSNALADALGNLLTDGSGKILITGAAA